jgi:hypothetical protein
MRRKKNKATKKVRFESLPLIHPNAAGIDVGSKEHLVAVPLDRDPMFRCTPFAEVFSR